MYRTTILPMDAIIAVALVDLSMQDCTLSDTVDALHSTFQKYPDFDYLLTAKKLLTKLNLYEIWQQELLFYGKLLQIDHKSLACYIEKGDPSLFAKYVDLVDDSVPLPASLVTSSYFNVNKKTNMEDLPTEVGNVNIKDKVVGNVSDKLAATLKKHATLNKEDRTIVQKKQSKRKRKQITVDTSSVVKKKQKKVGEPKPSNKKYLVSESDEEFDTSNILNAVPSVNDFFTDLGIDFKFKESPNQAGNTEESEHDVIGRHSTQKENVPNASSKIQSSDFNNVKDKSSESKDALNSSVKNMLKQFQCVKKHDLSKYEEKVEKPITQNKTIKLEVDAEISNNERVIGKSQLSIFETSGCEEVLLSHNNVKEEADIASANSSVNLNILKNAQVSFFENLDNENVSLNVSKLEKSIETSKNSSTNQKSLKSSQISIFESSDCDIDLDI